MVYVTCSERPSPSKIVNKLEMNALIFHLVVVWFFLIKKSLIFKLHIFYLSGIFFDIRSKLVMSTVPFSIFQSLIWMPSLSYIKILYILTAISIYSSLCFTDLLVFSLSYIIVSSRINFSSLHHIFILPGGRIILLYSLVSLYAPQ